MSWGVGSPAHEERVSLALPCSPHFQTRTRSPNFPSPCLERDHGSKACFCPRPRVSPLRLSGRDHLHCSALTHVEESCDHPSQPSPLLPVPALPRVCSGPQATRDRPLLSQKSSRTLMPDLPAPARNGSEGSGMLGSSPDFPPFLECSME